jgi:sulfate transport system substrate-binding protein
MARDDIGQDTFEIVYPSMTVLAEPPVAVVDSVVDRKGTRRAAEAYLASLYTPEMQEIIARRHFRPRDPAVAARHAGAFPAVETFDIASLGGWASVQAKHFADGGLFDHIYAPGK